MARSGTARLSILLAGALGALSCGDGTASSPTPPLAGSGLAVFTDSASVFSTTDVLDVDNQVVRFNPQERTLIWTPGNLLFDGWIVDGNFLGEGRPYQVRFGSVSGQRRAYFTETGRGTICDLEVENNILQIRPTNSLPPGT
jgi:hypothetical protein